MNRTYDNYLRSISVILQNVGTALNSVTNGYDSAGRLSWVGDGSATNYRVTYGYLANSPLVSSLAFTNGSNAGLVTTKDYDKLNRLKAISSKAYGSVASNLPLTSAYQYNAANQRTRLNQADGSYWVYQYDDLGQVISGKRYWSDGSPVDGQQLSVEYDWQGRRIRKQFSTYNGGFNEQSDVIYLYDGRRMLGELDANNSNARLRTYLWGSDFSGSLEGAIRGQLMVLTYINRALVFPYGTQAAH